MILHRTARGHGKAIVKSRVWTWNGRPTCTAIRSTSTSCARLFPPGSSDIAVARDDQGHYFKTARFDGSIESGGLHKEADRLLRKLNGLACVLDSSYRPVTLAGRYGDDTGHGVHVVGAATMEVRVKLSATGVVNGQAEQPPPPGPRLLALATRHPNVAEVLDLTGAASTLGPVELWKVYEVVRDDVGGGQKGLIGTGWITRAELSAFTGWANHPGVSGEDARHARGPGAPPKVTMSLPGAQDLIRRLVRGWMESQV